MIISTLKHIMMIIGTVLYIFFLAAAPVPAVVLLVILFIGSIAVAIADTKKIKETKLAEIAAAELKRQKDLEELATKREAAELKRQKDLEELADKIAMLHNGPKPGTELSPENTGHSLRTAALRLGVNLEVNDNYKVVIGKKVGNDEYEATIELKPYGTLAECIVVVSVDEKETRWFIPTYFPKNKEAYFDKHKALDASFKDSKKSVESLTLLHYQQVKGN